MGDEKPDPKPVIRRDAGKIKADPEAEQERADGEREKFVTRRTAGQVVR